jgi:DNA polymerase-3 subunit epsilon
VTGVVDSLALAKEQFPGKRNSLDALCDRFGIDNSSRTLHGALLDAELLADVYISLTRGQESLMMETGPGDDSQGPGAVLVDLSGIQLPVLRASAHELEAHAAMLLVIDKASGDKTIWKKISTGLQTS